MPGRSCSKSAEWYSSYPSIKHYLLEKSFLAAAFCSSFVHSSIRKVSSELEVTSKRLR